MRAKLILILALIPVVLLAGCASDGEDAAPSPQDPLMTIYRGAANDRLPQPDKVEPGSTTAEQQKTPKIEESKTIAQTTPGNQAAEQQQTDGEDAAPSPQDPLIAIYRGPAHDRLPQPDKVEPESSAEEHQKPPKVEENKPVSQTTFDNQAGKQSQIEAEKEATDSIPVSELEPRHQSLMLETHLPAQPGQDHQEPENVANMGTRQGDPLLSAYHRQIKASPLSDDVPPGTNLITAAPGTGEKSIKPSGQQEEPQKETRPQVTPENQTDTKASLYLQPLAESSPPEKTKEKKTENEPVLNNPPVQAPQKQVWIEQVDLIRAKGQIIVEIQLSGKASPNIFMLDEQGDRPVLVLDFPGVIGKSFPYRMSAPPTIATAIHMANYTEKARVVVDLIPYKSYEVQPAWLKGTNKLLVSISLL